MIAINNSWKLVPWADALYATDGMWWEHHKGVPEFKGKRITSSPRAARLFGLEMFKPSFGATSGMRAIDLAIKLQANPILLVGFEHHTRNGVHWHEPHSGPQLRNPSGGIMRTWLHDIEHWAPQFKKRGATIINCTPDSALRCFPYVPFEEAFAQWLSKSA